MLEVAVKETINHLFMDCEFFGGTWRLVLGWLGVSTVHPHDIGSQALQFGGTYIFHEGYLVQLSHDLVGLHLGHLERVQL